MSMLLVISSGGSLPGNDEVMVRLDGLEILEPYHLKDFNNAFSIVAPATLGGVALHTGGFPVEHGGRMSGILDLTSAEPTWRRHTELGLTLPPAPDCLPSGLEVLRVRLEYEVVCAACRGDGGSDSRPLEAEGPGGDDAFGK